jgi:AraC-like DNA-binding protein
LAGAPEAVVLDREMASERGWKILKVLKGNPATQHVPVLFYTFAGDSGSGSMLEIDYLTKPMGTAELAEALACKGLLDGEEDWEAEKKVLVVDDELGVLEMHARVVESQSPNYRVLRARNGREALEVIREEHPDLVLLDLMMPELDGFGVLEAMREEEMSRNIPVIVLTGQVLTEEDMARLNRGVASVLGKGLFSVEETLGHIETTLAHRRKLGVETQRVVRRAMAYVHTHYAEKVSLKELAAYVGLSEQHLIRSFRKESGITPIDYLKRYRLRRAKALLEAGDKSITEVALEVGFSDSSYFARVFRREVGVSPSAYRRGER